MDRLPSEHPRTILMETVTQWIARRTYHDMLAAMGGKPVHQAKIIAEGYGYKPWVLNFDALLAKLEIEDANILSDVRKMVETQDRLYYTEALSELLGEMAGKEPAKIRQVLQEIGQTEKCKQLLGGLD